MYSAIKKDDIIYLNMHCEEVMWSLFRDTSLYAIQHGFIGQTGIYIRELSQSTLFHLIKEMRSISEKCIVVDMSNIRGMNANSMSVFKELLSMLSERNTVILHHVCGEINDRILEEIEHESVYNCEERSFDVLIDSTKKAETLKKRNWKQEADKAFFERLEEELLSCCEEHNDKSLSSRIYLSKYINVKKLLRCYDFFCYCIYRLALNAVDRNVFEMSDVNDNSDKTVLVHTMNGIAIGSLLARLFGIDLLFIDHLGPLNRIYMENFSEAILPSKTYIIACDVICMGTELSAAKAILDVFGAKHNEVISLVKIETIRDIEDSIISLYEVRGKDNPLGYCIKTEV